MTEKEGPEKPLTEMREEPTTCPNCGQPAVKIIWNVGRLSMWMTTCKYCDENSAHGAIILDEGRQN